MKNQLKFFGFILAIVLAISLASASTWTSNLNDGLVTYYNFNEGTGTIAQDPIISNDGNVTGTWGAGILGDGVVLTGAAGEGIISLNDGGIIGTVDRTYSAWVNMSDVDNARQIIEQGDWTGSLLSIGCEGGSQHEFRISQGANADFSTTGVSLVADTWYHVVLEVNATNYTVFVNGVLNTIAPADLFIGANGLFYIGRRSYDESNVIVGIIDEVGIWNRTLNSSEVADLYNGGTGITYSPPTQTNYTNQYAVNITSPEDLTNYVVSVLVYANMSNLSGELVSFNNNFSDIVMSNNMWSWWLESNTSDYAKYWVKVPYLNASENNTIILHYNNQSVHMDSSSGTNVFWTFQIFGGPINTNWKSTYDDRTYAWWINNSDNIKINTSGNLGNDVLIWDIPYPYTNLEETYEASNPENNYWLGSMIACDANVWNLTTTCYHEYSDDPSGTRFVNYLAIGQNETNVEYNSSDPFLTPADVNHHTFTFKKIGSNISAYIDGIYNWQLNFTTDITGSTYGGLQGADGSQSEFYSYRVRYIIPNEPFVIMGLNMPIIETTYPENISYAPGLLPAALNYTISGEGINQCLYSTDNYATNISISCGDNVTGLTSIEGTNIWNVCVKNLVGFENCTSVQFEVSHYDAQSVIYLNTSGATLDINTTILTYTDKVEATGAYTYVLYNGNEIDRDIVFDGTGNASIRFKLQAPLTTYNNTEYSIIINTSAGTPMNDLKNIYWAADDFLGNAMNFTYWNINYSRNGNIGPTPAGCNFDVANGILTTTGPGGDSRCELGSNIGIVYPNITIEIRANFSTNSWDQWRIGFSNTTLPWDDGMSSGNINPHAVFYNYGDNSAGDYGLEYSDSSGGGSSTTRTSSAIATSIWDNFRISWNDSSMDWYMASTAFSDSISISQSISEYGSMGLHIQSNAANPQQIDYVKVYKTGQNYCTSTDDVCNSPIPPAPPTPPVEDVTGLANDSTYFTTYGYTYTVGHSVLSNSSEIIACEYTLDEGATWIPDDCVSGFSPFPGTYHYVMNISTRITDANGLNDSHTFTNIAFASPYFAEITPVVITNNVYFVFDDNQIEGWNCSIKNEATSNWDEMELNGYTYNKTITNIPVGSYIAQYNCTIENDRIVYNWTGSAYDIIAPPQIQIIYPENLSYDYFPTDLNYTVFTAGTFDNCWYSTDGYATNISIICGDNITGLTPIEGTNIWNVCANDTSNNENCTGVQFDVTLPVNLIINFTDPTLESNSYLQDAIWANISVITNTSEVANITIDLYNDLGIVDSQTSILDELVFYYNFTTLAYGNYYLNATACDINNLCNYTETRTYTLSPTTILIQIIFPENLTYGYYVPEDFNYTVSGTGTLDSCWYSVDGFASNSSIVCGDNITITATEGTNIYGVCANDTSNVENCSLVQFEVDSIAPQVFIIYPENLSYNYLPSELNYTVSDANIESCWYSTDNYATNTSIPCGDNITSLAAIEGTNIWYVCANDTWEHENCSLVQFEVDTKAPQISIIYPENLSYNYLPTDLNYTVFDANIESCWYSTDNYATNTSIPCGDNITSLAVINTNIWSVCSNDTFGNENCSTVQFEVDIGIPALTIIYPENLSYNYLPTDLNYTVADFNLDSCWYSTDNYATNTSIICGDNVTSLIATEGTNIWNVCANDTSNNENCTGVQFEVDTIFPTISIEYPQNITYNTLVNELNYTLFDLNLNSCWYSIDNYATNSSLPCGNNLTSVSPAIGTNIWTVCTNDTAGNENCSIVQFEENISFPIINIVYPQNITYNTAPLTELNYTISGTDIDSCWYSTDNYATNTSVPCGDNITGLTSVVGTNIWQVCVNNTIGLESCATNQFEISHLDAFIVYPVMNINYTNSTPVSELNYTIPWGSPTNCWYSLNGGNTNITITCGNNASSLTPNQGSNNWTICVQDSVNEVCNSTFFIYGSLPPIVVNQTIINESGSGSWGNNSYINETNLNLTANITTPANSSGLYNWTITVVNHTGGEIVTTGTGTFLSWWEEVIGLIVSLADGVYDWIVQATDIFGNTGTSDNQTFTIDTISAEIQFVTPTDTDNSLLNRSVMINVTANDTNYANMTIHVYDDTFIEIANESSNDLNHYVDFTLTDGDYYINATTWDLAMNSNVTETRHYLIDVTAPEIIWDYISQAGAFDYVYASFNYSDIHNNCTFIDLYNDTGLVENASACEESAIGNFAYNFTNLSDGEYYINATQVDSAGNYNFTSTQTRILYNLQPNVSFVNDTTTSSPGIQNNNAIWANVSINGSFIESVSIYLYDATDTLIDSYNESVSGTNATVFYNFTSLSDGLYHLNATGNNSVGLNASTETRDIYVSTTGATVLWTAPTTDNNKIVSSRIYANATATDIISIKNITITLYDNAWGEIMSYMFNNPSNNLTNYSYYLEFTPSEGTYKLNATVVNIGNFKTYFPTRTITVAKVVNVTACRHLDEEGVIYRLAANITDNTLTGPCIIFDKNSITFNFYDDITGRYNFIMSNQNYPAVYTNQNNSVILNAQANMGDTSWDIEGYSSQNILIKGGALVEQEYAIKLNRSFGNITDMNLFEGGGRIPLWILNSDIEVVNCSYSAADLVNAATNLTREWYYAANVKDNVQNVIDGALVTLNSSSSLGLRSYAIGSMTDGNTPIIKIEDYKMYQSSKRLVGPYTVRASFTAFDATTKTYTASVEASKVYDFLVLNGEIASTPISRTAMRILLGILMVIGIAASVGFFMYRMRDGDSVVDIWKYFIIMIIWIVIFIVCFLALSSFIMKFLYPAV